MDRERIFQKITQNLVFCLSSEVSSRFWNFPSSPRDIIHVEQGIDDKKQVPKAKDI